MTPHPPTYASAVNLGYLETILVLPTRRQNFAGKLHLVLRNIWDLVIYGFWKVTTVYNVDTVNTHCLHCLYCSHCFSYTAYTVACKLTYMGCPNIVTFMLLEPQCTSSITSSQHPSQSYLEELVSGPLRLLWLLKHQQCWKWETIQDNNCACFMALR